MLFARMYSTDRMTHKVIIIIITTLDVSVPHEYNTKSQGQIAKAHINFQGWQLHSDDCTDSR